MASSTVERPRSVICTSVVRPSVGCGHAARTSPSASSRRIACVTLVTCTCSRSDALVIGKRSAAAERQQPQQLEAGEAQVVRTQRGLDAGQQDLVGAHHRRHRDHALAPHHPSRSAPNWLAPARSGRVRRIRPRPFLPHRRHRSRRRRRRQHYAGLASTTLSGEAVCTTRVMRNPA